MGVSVPAEIEAVVRHSLEKEIGARIDSVDSFLKELRAAMSSSPFIPTSTRETGAMDPNRTMASGLEEITSHTAVDNTDFGASYESMAGTVSAAALDEELKRQVSDTAATHRREQEERERAAREALAREALAREAEAQLKAKEEAERQVRDFRTRNSELCGEPIRKRA